MFQYCKLCNNCMFKGPSFYVGENVWLYPFRCSRCPEYTLDFNDETLSVDCEKVSVKNFYLHYSPLRKAGIIWQKDGGRARPIHRIEIKELTPELVKQWVDKLQKYVIFQ